MGFFDSISNGISSAWNSVKSLPNTIVNGISSAGSTVFNFAKDKVVNPVANVVTGVYQNEIKPAVTTIYNDVSGIGKNISGGIAKLEGGVGDFLSNGFAPIAIGAVAIGALMFLRK